MEEQNEHGLTKKERRELRRQLKAQARAKAGSRKFIRSLIIWGAMAVVVVGIIAGLIINAKNKNSDEFLPGEEIVFTSIQEQDWTKGSVDAKVELIEYSDFQCPACLSYYSIIARLSDEYSQDVRVAYRNLPLPTHANGNISAQAAEAAGLQGKFWEMHDKLFENQQSWASERDPKDTFIRYAEEIGLDSERFKSDLTSKQAKDAVEQDVDSYKSFGIPMSTPTFFLNGVKITNPRGYDAFRNIIEQELKLAESKSDAEAQ
ncbi:MAG: protein-disulfide isomerase [uncultured bacterium]|nr:MAG: protein-disulfide isomerase [uncultured bacterium]